METTKGKIKVLVIFQVTVTNLKMMDIFNCQILA